MKIALLAALAAAAVISAQTIAVIDSERIFDDLGEVADATELLESEIEEWEAHADSLQVEIDAIRTDLEYTMVMSPERRREREVLLEEKTVELQEYLSRTFGPGGLVESRNAELVSPIVAGINEAVQEISIEEGFDIVLDTSGGLVVYVSNSIDITDMVLERLATGGND
ncbi:MAG: OmpH family outer membrane protein [Candidatus Fermentibacteraceae bacterium]|nr:OmpH family outer membrane protein [Candidatus Fermentibacteraceae bacterium]MBN2609041.1 OmpH family outer membrane protein [Candidatus Fermentibacteraceae bacterium]